jgi:hypothetical protein
MRTALLISACALVGLVVPWLFRAFARRIGHQQMAERERSRLVVAGYEHARHAQFAYRRGAIASYAALFLALGSPALLTPLFMATGEPGFLFVAAACGLFLMRGAWLLHLGWSARPAVVLTEDRLCVGRKEIRWANVKGARLAGSRGRPALVITYEEGDPDAGRVVRTRTLRVAIDLIENNDALLRCLKMTVVS